MQPNAQKHRFRDHKYNRLTWGIKMENRTKRGAFFVLAASAVVLAGCGGSGSGDVGTTGFISLGVSDGPVRDAKKVCITFTEIELKSGSNTTLLDLEEPDGPGPQTVNLLDFQGDQSTVILGNAEVTAGEYQWMRLGIDAVMSGSGGVNDEMDSDACADGASYMVMDGGSLHNLYVPSSAQNGLKLVGGFTVPANGSASFTAEWDLMRSITAPQGLDPDVVMKPVIRLVNNVEVGTLTGLVATELATAEACEPFVYVADADSESEEFDPNDAVATAMVYGRTNDDGSVEWHYTVGFLLAGDYEAAFTCNGTDFEPIGGKPALIAVNETMVVDF
jgi:hypothetical protein